MGYQLNYLDRSRPCSAEQGNVSISPHPVTHHQVDSLVANAATGAHVVEGAKEALTGRCSFRDSEEAIFLFTGWHRKVDAGKNDDATVTPHFIAPEPCL